jgi:hypothetical protein
MYRMQLNNKEFRIYLGYNVYEEYQKYESKNIIWDKV